MGISGVNATSNATASAVAASGGVTSGDFLSLLVNELQNQDPLDPTSTTDFINQMSSYATFDQEQSLNTNLNTLLSSFNSLLTMNSVNYLGHDVIAKGNVATLQNGQASFGYDLTAPAANVSLTVQDSQGNVVWSGTGPAAQGMNTVSWNGTNSSGAQLQDGGQYTLNVTATDAAGNSVYNYSTFTGTVTGVDSSSGTTMLDVGGVPVDVSNIVGVKS
jgi:flagellar basal-body rod modification protein FlgD